MPRKKNPVPKYSHHKPTGQAYVRVPDGNGGRRPVYLGRYDSPESKREYERVLAELRVPGAAARRVTAAPPCPTVNELLLAWMQHAQRHYRRADGTPTGEVSEYRYTVRVVRELYGHTPGRDFGPLALEAVRNRMVELGWCRTLVNRRVERIKRAWKWAAAREMVPVAAYQALRTLAGLREGRSDARESEPVGPADPAAVEKTLPFLSRHVRGLVTFCRLTGCRPGEACRLTRAQIDAAGSVWLYRPVQHKGRHRGKQRLIPIGPRGQALLAEFPTANPDDPVFSPRLAREERYAAARAARKGKLYPSQVKPRKASPRRSPRDRYSASAFAGAVGRAAERAGVAPWHPNQLRHLLGTEVRREYGLEAAGAVLGHAKLSATQVYAQRDADLAMKVAAERG
jgi:integrase